MDSVIVYLALSGAVGLIQFYGTYKIHRYETVKINWAMGLVETVWFVVSCYVLWKMNFTVLEKSVAIVFIANMMSSTITLSGWFNRDPENAQGGFKIPVWYIYLSFVFEFVFVSLSMWALLNHELQENVLSTMDYIKTNIITIILFILGILFIGSLFWAFYKKGQQWLNDDVQAAITKHETCFDVFGIVKHIELDQEVTDEYEMDDVFAYFVTGEKTSGLLVAEIKTNLLDKEEIVQGFIELSDGEVIEIDEPEGKEF
ncbi:MAG: hypothetical protein KAT06_06920 [Gammaproteobacteria bacterium]|nr:hypothetical protein [Gammaproteobacteria bacterium]